MKVKIRLGDSLITTTPRVAELAGWAVELNSPSVAKTDWAERRLARALSEGLEGEAALFRAIALGEEAAADKRAIDVQAARAQAARLELELERTRADEHRRRQAGR